MREKFNKKSKKIIIKKGKFINFAGVEGQVITPNVSSETFDLTQTGPGQYQGRFQADTGLAKPVGGKHQISGHDFVFEDLLLVIDIVDKTVQRGDPLLQAA